jgi:hypothetical protein
MKKFILTNGKELLIELINYKNRSNQEFTHVRYSINQIGCVFDDIKDLIKTEDLQEVLTLNSKLKH